MELRSTWNTFLRSLPVSDLSGRVSATPENQLRWPLEAAHTEVDRLRKELGEALLCDPRPGLDWRSDPGSERDISH